MFDTVLNQLGYDKAVELATAEAMFPFLPDDIQAMLGAVDDFNEKCTKLDCLKHAVVLACKDNARYRYGTHVKNMFAPNA